MCFVIVMMMVQRFIISNFYNDYFIKKKCSNKIQAFL